MTADFLEPARYPGARSRAAEREWIVKLFCVIYPTLALGLYYAFREPQGLIKAGGIAQALMLPFIAGATIYLRRRDADRRVGPSSLAISSPGLPSSRSREWPSTASFDQVKGMLPGFVRGDDRGVESTNLASLWSRTAVEFGLGWRQLDRWSRARGFPKRLMVDVE